MTTPALGTEISNTAVLEPKPFGITGTGTLPQNLYSMFRKTETNIHILKNRIGTGTGTNR